MVYKKTLSFLVCFIIILSFIASWYGVFSNQGSGEYDFVSIHGKTITIYGKGLYKNESSIMAYQAIGQDVITMFLAIPLIILSLILTLKNSLKGKLLLAGTLGYFLYTYVTYSFLAMYNDMFLIYVILMSLSFFAFLLTMTSFDYRSLDKHFSDKLPVKFIGGFQIFLATAFGLMWLGLIVPPLLEDSIPEKLEHYTSLIIQALDLGIFLPTIVLSAILIIKRNGLGYLLSSIIIIKGITLLTAITAMMVMMYRAGEDVGIVEISIIPIFNLVIIYCLYLIMKNVKEPILGGRQ